MQCRSCHADNPRENRFRDQCGAALEARCPQCSAPVRVGARFCGAGGQRPTAEPVQEV
ncbi:MAG: zinc ribbon domain-containing protein [Candidatus Rokubacteria bacterium]|nr:zinc ribbon domain-containing protein [Candidatus Rokubacteria bacterium]